LYSQIFSGLLLLVLAFAAFWEIRKNGGLSTPMEEAATFV
jgi:hypothetical protein